MSKFVMKNRPKKPTEPRTIYFEVGDYVTLGYFTECVEKFKAENPDRSPKQIMLSVEEGYEGYVLQLEATPQSQMDYEATLQTYKVELQAYESWRVKHKKEIEKWKAAGKKVIAKRKLEKRMVRLAKELEEVEAKLVKA
jgi:hypothetical protein